jgi:hypothetical protein
MKTSNPLTYVAAGVLCISLGACASTTGSNPFGTVTGAVIGGAIGSVMTGHFSGTIVGAVVGGVAGYRIAKRNP